MFDGLQVAVDDSLLVRVLHGRADLREEVQVARGHQPVLVAVFGERDALDQLHDEEGRPVSVVPASNSLAMCGWSISAMAWRSASNRARTVRESMPGLMSFTATCA